MLGKSAPRYITTTFHYAVLKKLSVLDVRRVMKLIDIDKMERKITILELKLKEAHDWIKHMGDWDKYKQRSKYDK